MSIEAENAWLKDDANLLHQTVVKQRQEIEAMKQALEQTQMALREQFELNKNIVAAAYRAAAEVCRKASGPQSGAKEILAITPADAEQALREFGIEVAHAIAADEDFKRTFEQIVEEVMKK
jgi:hypothetical protein